MKHDNITPYQNQSSKKEQVRNMFDAISQKYDLLNRILSLGIDIYWRKILIKKLGDLKNKTILDVATGTGDLALALYKKNPKKVVGLDISPQMLEMAKKKNDSIQFTIGDSENLPYSKDIFDIVTIAFGARNFENLERGLSEIYRTLKLKGSLAILEFGLPKLWILKKVYLFYFNYIVPFIGKIFSKDKKAYLYLPNSVQVFPYGKEFIKVLDKVGFKDIQTFALTGGICYLYIAKKNI